jgi:glycolate oxidase
MSVDGRVDETVLAALSEICGEEGVSTETRHLRSYGRDKITEEHYAGTADVVVWPRSTADVARIVGLAREGGVPVTPRGGGSGLSGGAVPVRGGIVMSMERMNRVLEIDEENLLAVLEPGIVTKDLDRVLEPYGLFFAGYPMSEEVCELGGNVAENAGGGRAVKYGVTGDYVLGLEVVTGTGEVLRLGGKRIKDVTGYDLVSLFVGSEGTLGIITEITLRLLPRPNARQAVLGFLPDESALRELTPALLRRLSARPSSIEMADATCMRILKTASRTWSRIPDGASMLLVEFDGVDETVLGGQAQEAVRLLESHGGLDIRHSESREEFEELWRVRKQVPWALMRISPHQTLEDVTVPVSEAWPLIARTRELSAETGIEIANFGHLGDGNIHCTPVKPEDETVERWHERVPELLERLYREVFALGGTISGEHGIGHKRREYMPLVFGEAELSYQRGLKRLFDPDGILNPGKVV